RSRIAVVFRALEGHGRVALALAATGGHAERRDQGEGQPGEWLDDPLYQLHTSPGVWYPSRNRSLPVPRRRRYRIPPRSRLLAADRFMLGAWPRFKKLNPRGRPRSAKPFSPRMS